MFKLAIFSVVVLGAFPPLRAQDCSLDLALPADRPQPLVLTNNPADPEFVYPSRQNLITINNQTSVIIACPTGLYNNLTASIIATCDKGILTTGTKGAQVNFQNSNLSSCTRTNSTVRNLTTTCASPTDIQIDIGYQLNATIFIRQILICFDNVRKTPLFVQQVVSQFAQLFATGRDNDPRFSDDGFYLPQILDVQAAYLVTAQRATINSQLGLLANDTTYVTNSPYGRISHGHLAPNGDFLFQLHQHATFRSVNAAPQWQYINGGNWALVETDVRQKAANLNRPLIVYTGTFGVSTLPHRNGTAIPLYLFTNTNSNLLPIPELFWKVVYDENRHQGTVVITHNNPFVNTTANPITKICPSVTPLPAWLNRTNSFANARTGFTYVCNLGEFRQSVTYAPNLNVSMGLIP